MPRPVSPILATPSLSREDMESLLILWLSGRKETTRAAYAQDVAAFASWLGKPQPVAVAELLGRGGPAAAVLVLRYRAELLATGKSPATVARRLSGLRSLVNLARLTGAMDWTLEVSGPEWVAYRDTRGPGTKGVGAMLAAAERAVAAAEAEAAGRVPITPRRGVPRSARVLEARRGLVILRLLADCALRRAEVVTLDVGHVDLAACEGRGALLVLGKGRTEREAITLPPKTRAAVMAYLAVHPTPDDPAAPLFPGAGASGRLTGRTVARVVAAAAVGGAVGRHVRPHGLRHTAITEALEQTRGDVRRVARFSRHRDLRTLTIYDDNRRDLGGEVAALVSEAW